MRPETKAKRRIALALSITKQREEVNRLQIELDSLDAFFAKDGIVRTVLRERIHAEKLRLNCMEKEYATGD